jgi:aryl-alcohol dehydrogenase-like predicted oxidoreductase
VDLYQTYRFDPHTPIEKTLGQLVCAGKVPYIGASSMYAWQFLKLLQTSSTLGLAHFVSMQNHYNLVYRDVPPRSGNRSPEHPPH